jgi:hypothetical protein
VIIVHRVTGGCMQDVADYSSGFALWAGGLDVQGQATESAAVAAKVPAMLE